MNKKQIMKVSPLVGAVLLALSAPVAMATITAPATGTLPGSFSSNVSTVTYGTVGNTTTATITVSAGSTVLQWGGGTAQSTPVAAPSGITANAGFDIGSGAALTVTNSSTAVASVLISDQTGNPSQIYGTLTAAGAVGAVGAAPSLFVANANGVIVGNGATVTLPAGGGFIGEKVSEASFSTDEVASSITDTGAVSIASGTVTAAGYLLVAGNGNVNVGSVATSGSLTEGVVNGFNFTAGPSGAIGSVSSGPTFASVSSAVVNLSGAYTTTPTKPTVVYAAGNVNLTGTAMNVSLAAVNGNLVNSGSATISAAAAIGGSFTNHGTATLTVSSFTAASIVNTGTVKLVDSTGGFNLEATAGTITNNGTIDATGATGAITLSATATSGAGIINTGTIANVSGAYGLYMSASSGNISNTGTLNFTGNGAGTLSAVATAGNVTLDGTVNMGTLATPLSAANYLGNVTLEATGGALNLGSNTLYVSSATTDTLSGNSVQVSAGGLIDVGSATLNVTAASGNVTLWGGTTLAAPIINVSAGSTGNLVLAGQLGNSSSTTITVTAGNIMAGVNTMGGFNLSPAGTNSLTLDVYGNVVNQHGDTAAAINYAKYVPVNATGGTANIVLNAENAGTAVQYINLGVDGNAVLTGTTSGASPVTVGNANGNNITNYPFGALTLQATGNIILGSGTTGFYFPGQLRFANVKTLSNSSFTLNPSSTTGTITLKGELANDVTSQILGNGGISFLTDNALTGLSSGGILTNTNAWVNFASGTGLVTTYNTLNPTNKSFYGLTYKNGVYTTALVGGTNKANVFNSVTMP